MLPGLLLLLPRPCGPKLHVPCKVPLVHSAVCRIVRSRCTQELLLKCAGLCIYKINMVDVTANPKCILGNIEVEQLRQNSIPSV